MGEESQLASERLKCSGKGLGPDLCGGRGAGFGWLSWGPSMLGRGEGLREGLGFALVTAGLR